MLAHMHNQHQSRSIPAPTITGVTTEGAGVSSFLLLRQLSAAVNPVVVLRHHSPSQRAVLLATMASMEAIANTIHMDTDRLTRHAAAFSEGRLPFGSLDEAGLPGPATGVTPLRLLDGCSLSLCLGTARHDPCLSSAHIIPHRSGLEAEALWAGCVAMLASTHLEDRGGAASCTMFGQRSSIITGVFCSRDASGVPPIDVPSTCTKSTFTIGLITRAHPCDPAIQDWIDEWVAHLEVRLQLHQEDAAAAAAILSQPLSFHTPTAAIGSRKAARHQQKLLRTGVLGVMGRGDLPATTFAATVERIVAADRFPLRVIPSLPVPLCSSLRDSKLSMFVEPRGGGRPQPGQPLPPVSLIYSSSANVPFSGAPPPATPLQLPPSSFPPQWDMGLFPGGTAQSPHYSEVFAVARVGLIRPTTESILGNSTYDFASNPVLCDDVRDALWEEGEAVRARMLGPLASSHRHCKPSLSSLPSRAATVTRNGVSTSPDLCGSSPSSVASSCSTPQLASPDCRVSDSPRSLNRFSTETCGNHSPLSGATLGCSPPNRYRGRRSSSTTSSITALPSSPLNTSANTTSAAGLPPQWRTVRPATRKLTFGDLSLANNGRYVLSGHMAPSFLYEPFVAPLCVRMPLIMVGTGEDDPST